MEDEVVVLHAFDNRYIALCGANWEWGRKETEFMVSVENHYPVLVRCKECVEKVKEKGIKDGKNSVSREIIFVS